MVKEMSEQPFGQAVKNAGLTYEQIWEYVDGVLMQDRMSSLDVVFTSEYKLTVKTYGGLTFITDTNPTFQEAVEELFDMVGIYAPDPMDMDD